MQKRLYIILAVIALACSQNAENPKEADYSSVDLANEKDPVCEMPIKPSTAKDTLHTEEGVYGFCCEGCKDEYRNQLAHQL